MQTQICNLCLTSFEVDPPVALRKDGFDLIRCRCCGLLRRATMPTVGELSSIYAEDYFRDNPDHQDSKGYVDYLADEPLHRRNARR